MHFQYIEQETVYHLMRQLVHLIAVEIMKMDQEMLQHIMEI